MRNTGTMHDVVYSTLTLVEVVHCTSIAHYALAEVVYSTLAKVVYST
jgi:hypothetical protein